MSKKRTEVCITIDTEFNIAGHFSAPQKYLPISDIAVTCPVDGKEQGLGFLLETFDQFETDATFFLETANHAYFGDEPMQSIAKRIQQADHDIQLHVHPVWLSFLNRNDEVLFPRNDNCADRSFDDLKRAFSYCIEIFKNWIGYKPLALRTGSLWADLNVYSVLAELEIPMASNLGLGIYTPPEPSLQLMGGRHRIKGVMEIPVLTYQDAKFGRNRHLKSLQITSCSWPEMKRILWAARKLGVEQIVVLTHPFEFIKKSDFRYTKTTNNKLNQKRLQRLCEFIQTHDQDFVSTNFSQSAKTWTSTEVEDPFVAIPSIYSIGRKLENKLNDTIWSY
ncbi:hypothetical protein [Thalassotalea montiporae]